LVVVQNSRYRFTAKTLVSVVFPPFRARLSLALVFGSHHAASAAAPGPAVDVLERLGV
jgi:hypothetical protein